jgi:hypothetical protein
MGIARWEIRVQSRCEVQPASDDLVMSFQVAKRGRPSEHRWAAPGVRKRFMARSLELAYCNENVCHRDQRGIWAPDRHDSPSRTGALAQPVFVPSSVPVLCLEFVT